MPKFRIDQATSGSPQFNYGYGLAHIPYNNMSNLWATPLGQGMYPNVLDIPLGKLLYANCEIKAGPLR